ncbi:Uncharacterised protein [uncultured archaeon]|nr:Uncharacterised protein [uncultured archaeon]
MGMLFFSLAAILGDYCCASIGILIILVVYALKPKDKRVRNHAILAFLVMLGQTLLRILATVLATVVLSALGISNGSVAIIVIMVALLCMLISVMAAAMFAYWAYKSHQNKNYMPYQFVK